MNDITDYLQSIGFKAVIQTDNEGKFTDYTYLKREGLYFELHDDNMIFVWYDITNPLIAKTHTPENDFEVRLQIQQITTTYETNIKV